MPEYKKVRDRKDYCTLEEGLISGLVIDNYYRLRYYIQLASLTLLILCAFYSNSWRLCRALVNTITKSLLSGLF